MNACSLGEGSFHLVPVLQTALDGSTRAVPPLFCISLGWAFRRRIDGLAWREKQGGAEQTARSPKWVDLSLTPLRTGGGNGKHLAALAGGLPDKEGRAECSVRHLTCAAEFVAKEPGTGVDL